MNITFTQIEGYADGQRFRAIRNADDTISIPGSLAIDRATKEKLIAHATVALVKLSVEPKTAQT